MMTFLKQVLCALWYRPGTTHRILLGPMRGLRFRFSENTGLAALYSGNEQEHQKLYATLVRPGDVVLDAGANWGVHALYLATLTQAAGRVLAFEPHPEVSAELQANVSCNGLSQVTVLDCCLSDKEGEIPFTLGQSSKTSHIDGTHDSSAGISVMVRCRTLDSVVEEMGLTSVRLIKVDVEGAEARLLRGAQQTILRFRPHLVVELHNPQQDMEVAQLLREWGYAFRRLEGPIIKRFDVPWPDPDGVWGTLHAMPE